MNPHNASPTSKLTVDLNRYGENLRAIRGRLPESCGIMPIVKSNAYGMGAVPIAERALAEGAAMLAVASVAEAAALREAGIEAPILLLVQPREDDLPLVIRYKLRMALSNFATAEKLGDLARKAHTVAAVHCEIDTGMGRQGFSAEEAATELRNLTRISNVDIEGIFTHFAVAERAQDPFTENQLRVFRHVIKQLSKEGVPYEMVHAANSSAILNFPQSALDLVRPGLITYGVYPEATRPADSSFIPIMTWTTTIVLVRNIAGGASISYGRTYFAPSPMRVAALPVGYADGYPFHLSNKSDVLIRGTRCPVRGRVTMNEMLVDVTHVPDANVGDRVTLIGSDGSDSITVEELAEKAETVPHAILTGIGAHVTRDYIT